MNVDQELMEIFKKRIKKNEKQDTGEPATIEIVLVHGDKVLAKYTYQLD